jgi:hypothetical protein
MHEAKFYQTNHKFNFKFNYSQQLITQQQHKIATFGKPILKKKVKNQRPLTIVFQGLTSSDMLLLETSPCRIYVANNPSF